MKIRHLTFALCLAASTAIATAQAPAAPAAPAATPGATAPSAFKTEKERMSYAVGLQIGINLKGMDMDTTAIAAGMKDSSTGAKPQMSDKEIEESLTALKTQMMAKGQAEQAAAADKNKKAGEAYLAENAKKEGVKTTASGLQYKVLKTGTGKTPKATDTVSVEYRGTLIGGKEFDASRGTPVSFPVNRVIPGWTEALQLMKEGDKWQLTIPSKLAYDMNGAGEDIGPNEVLVFDVELLQVKGDAAK